MAITVIKKSQMVKKEKKVFEPSPYQKAIYDWMLNGIGNAVVNAVAGSGKSTTIKNALELLPTNQTKCLLAFNNPIVKALRADVDHLPNVTVNTLHAHGFSAMKGKQVDKDKYLKKINMDIDYGYIKPTVELTYEQFGEYKQNIQKLVDLYRNYMCKSINDLLDVAIKYQINLFDNELEIAQNIVNWGVDNSKTIDFGDMIYLPVIYNSNIEQYDWILIDEVQDLNTAQKELFLMSVKKGGRWIGVGDPSQSIYGFAGADIESFNILKNQPNTIELPLSVCYRCGSSIVDYAKSIVPQIEARENAPSGIVDENALLADIKDNDLVLCRNTAPLVSLCIKYIANKVKAYVKGRDVGLNLINMIKNTTTKKIPNRRMVEVIEKLEIEQNKLATKIARKLHCSETEARENSLYQALDDKVRAIEVVSQGLQWSDQAIEKINSIFADDNGEGICLSTIHKAKGLEADSCFIICRDKMYNKRSMKIPWMAVQENNLAYVAYTRGKNKLGFIIDFDPDNDRD